MQPQIIQANVIRADIFIGAPYMGSTAYRPGLGGRMSVEMVPVYYQIQGNGFDKLKSCQSIYLVGATDYKAVFSWTQNAYVVNNYIVIRQDNQKGKPLPINKVRRIVCVHHGGQSYAEIKNGLPQTFQKHQL